MEELQTLKALYRKGFLSKEEYDERRLRIIDSKVGIGGGAKRSGSSGGTGSSRARSNASPASSSATSSRAPRATRSAQPQRAKVVQVGGRSRGGGGGAQQRRAAAQPRSAAQAKARQQEEKKQHRFDPNQKYDPTPNKRAYKEDHLRPSIPKPKPGTSGERVVIDVSSWTKPKEVYRQPTPKLWLGPSGSSGGVFGTQKDVRAKLAIADTRHDVKALPADELVKKEYVTVETPGKHHTFQEAVSINASVLDLIEICLKRLGMSQWARQFGILLKTGQGSSWISPDTLVCEIDQREQLVLLPKQMAPKEVKKQYVAKLASSNKLTSDPQNEGAQLYYAY